MIDKNRLEEKCSTWNIALTGTQLDQLDAFAEILVEYNQKVNLTAITDPEGIEDKHFLDSLLFAAQPEVAGKMVDVGAGAGFPGIVTKIYKPELELTLMEPTGKRVEFLKYACGQLGLTGVEFAKERAEEAARKSWREQFDLASARAVAALPMLAEYCLPLVKVGGSFLAMRALPVRRNSRQPAAPSGSWAARIRRPAPCICPAATPAPSSSAKRFRKLRQRTPEMVEKSQNRR